MRAMVTSTMKKCKFCAEEILPDAVKCKHCGEMLESPATSEHKWNPGTAAVLSFLIPGAGQIYKGEIGLGLGFLFFTIVGYLLFILPGVFLHIICVVVAYDGGRSQRTVPRKNG